MPIKLIDAICTCCGNDMRLPEHIADLPCDGRLCGECAKRLLKQSLCVLEQLGMFGKRRRQLAIEAVGQEYS